MDCKVQPQSLLTLYIRFALLLAKVAQPAKGGGRMMGGDDAGGDASPSETHTRSIETVFQIGDAGEDVEL
jgi:hypothetical protein